MAHGIQEEDRGYVFGTTWHGLRQYVQLDRPPTREEALQVLDYPLVKQPLYRMVGGVAVPVVKAFCIVRADTDKVLLPTCGEVMTVQNNATFFRLVEEGLLNAYPELQLESVGTLWGGQTAFVNIKLAEWAVKGDQSSTVSRLMYFNPLGFSYQACAHDVRIVCNNTLRMAVMSGEANRILAKFRHTGTASREIRNYLIDLAELKLGLKKHQELLNELARRPITTAEVDKFLAAFLPAPEGPPPKRLLDQRNQIRNAFESDQSLGAIGKTRYGLLQAVTYTVDHGKLRKDQDEMALRWDGIVGGRADKKQQALDLLLQPV